VFACTCCVYAISEKSQFCHLESTYFTRVFPYNWALLCFATSRYIIQPVQGAILRGEVLEIGVSFDLPSLVLGPRVSQYAPLIRLRRMALYKLVLID